MKILLARLEPMHWLQPSVLSPPNDGTPDDRHSFINYVLPLLMYYGNGVALRNILRDHPWLGSCTVPAKRHEDAWLFHQNPTRNIEVIEDFLKLKFCEIFGSRLLQRSTVCGVFYQYYLSALEKKVRALCSKEVEPEPSRAHEDVFDANSPHDANMQSVYGDSWRDYYSK